MGQETHGVVAIDFEALLKEAKKNRRRGGKVEGIGEGLQQGHDRQDLTGSLQGDGVLDGRDPTSGTDGGRGKALEGRPSFRLVDALPLELEELDESNRVGGSKTAYYFPDWLTPDEEAQLLQQINDPKWDHHWVSLKTRRLQNLGGTPQPEGFAPDPLPDWAHPLLQRLVEENVFPDAPNHILVNEYSPGQGIMPHEDGPLYIPNVAIVSLGSALVMDIRPHPTKHPEGSLTSSATFSLLLEPRSLFIFRDEVYRTHLHGIEARTEDVLPTPDCIANSHLLSTPLDFSSPDQPVVLPRSLRVSLTIRRVSKTFEPPPPTPSSP
jgi:alkylated DNA repair protein alkB family protein 6